MDSEGAQRDVRGVSSSAASSGIAGIGAEFDFLDGLDLGRINCDFVVCAIRIIALSLRQQSSLFSISLVTCSNTSSIV